MWQSTILVCIVFAETADWVNSECHDRDLMNRFLRNTPRSKFLNQILVFKGLNGNVFGDLTTHYEKETFTLNISSPNPNVNVKDNAYFWVSRRDGCYPNMVSKFMRIVKGVTSPSFDEVPMKEGTSIIIMHQDAPKGFYSADGITETKTKKIYHRFIVTRYGLENTALGNIPLIAFLNKLNLHAKTWRSSTISWSDTDLGHLLIGVRSLPEPYRTQFVKNYTSIMSQCSKEFILGSVAEEGKVTMTIISFADVQHATVGIEVVIKSGSYVAFRETITDNATIFRDVHLPYGVYSVDYLGNAVEKFIIYPQYIEVKNPLNIVEITFWYIFETPLYNEPLYSENTFNSIDTMAQEIANDDLRSGVPLHFSDEKKLLLFEIRSIPDARRDALLDKYSYLFSNEDLRDYGNDIGGCNDCYNGQSEVTGQSEENGQSKVSEWWRG